MKFQTCRRKITILYPDYSKQVIYFPFKKTGHQQILFIILQKPKHFRKIIFQEIIIHEI